MRRFTAVLATMAILFIPLERASARTQTESGQDALSWLTSQVNPDGSVAGFSPIGGSADALFAVAAGGLDPNAWPAASGPRPIAYLQSVANATTTATDEVRDDAARSAKVALAAKLADRNPRSFGGADLIGFINSYYNSGSGLYGTDLFDQTFAFLALRAAGDPIPPAAVDALLDAQSSVDGGWEFQNGFGTDTNTSALAVQALLAAQPVTPAQQAAINEAIASAVGYLQGEQNSDGGFAYQQVFASNFCGGVNPSDANSTAYVIQAIRAAGQDPKSSPWTQVSTNPVGFLFGLQSANGSFSYQDGPDCLNDSGATSQAVPAILEQSFLCLLGFASCPTLASGSTQPSPSPSPSVAPGGGVSATPTTKASTPSRRRIARGAAPSPSPALESSDATQPSAGVVPTLEPNQPSPPDDGLANPSRAAKEPDATNEPSALPWILGFGALGALALAGLYMAGRRSRQGP